MGKSSRGDDDKQIANTIATPTANNSKKNIARRGFDLPSWRKWAILAVVSWNTLLISYSSTALVIATQEISSDLNTTSETIDATNAAVLVLTGSSALLWNPFSDVFGRRVIYNIALMFLLLPTIGAALAPNFATFIAMRLISALCGTYMMVAGQTFISDIFEPLVRGKAVGFFMVGSVAGPAFGPCIAGIIITFASWRAIFWLQVAMSGLGFILSIIIIPNIRRETDSGTSNESDEIDTMKTGDKIRLLFRKLNPMRVFRLLARPNILLADVTCGFLAVTQYGIITSVRQIINPRFNLSTPLISGLFYIAPGVGFFVGSVVGGRLSDRTVKKYIGKRDGVRLPEDRLNSGLIGMFVVLPISMLLYAWSLEKGFGGLALPIVAAFWIGVGVMGTFNSLNTYTAEVSPPEKAEVICSKYNVQYCFGAASNGACVPMINAMGVGWTFTLFMFLNILGGLLVVYIARYRTKHI